MKYCQESHSNKWNSKSQEKRDEKMPNIESEFMNMVINIKGKPTCQGLGLQKIHYVHLGLFAQII